jgi:3-isopropylmalate/(R)-2-methylmalate dehydratase small subunit
MNGEKLKGKVWKFGDNINTDLIIPGRFMELSDPKEMAKHAMEGVDPIFSEKVNEGDFIVGGKNFGCGSSREHAPIALKHSGVGGVVAESFARIFYRNSINIGLPVIECPGVSEMVNVNDEIEIDITGGTIFNVTTGASLSFSPLPEFMLKILEEGGLVQYLSINKKEWME